MDNEQISRRLWPSVSKWPPIRPEEPNRAEQAGQAPSSSPDQEASAEPSAAPAYEMPTEAPWDRPTDDAAELVQHGHDEAPWDRPADPRWAADAYDPGAAPWDRPSADEPQIADDAADAGLDPDDSHAPVVSDIRRGTRPGWRSWPADRPVSGGPAAEATAADDVPSMSPGLNRPPAPDPQPRNTPDVSASALPDIPAPPAPSISAPTPSVTAGQWFVATPADPGMPQQLVLRIEVAIVGESNAQGAAPTARVVGTSAHVSPPAPADKASTDNAPWEAPARWDEEPWETADPLSDLPAAHVAVPPARAGSAEPTPRAKPHIVAKLPSSRPEEMEEPEEPADDEQARRGGGWVTSLLTAAGTILMAIAVVALGFVFVQVATSLLR